MNWTGGRLQRHSKTQDAVKQRQKAYFAKSRQQRQTTKRRSCNEFVPDYLQRQYLTRVSGTQSHVEYASRQRQLASQTASHGTYTKARPKLASSHDNHASATPMMRALDAETSHQLEIDLARRRLLKQADWAGLDIIRPLSLDFQNDDRHDLGKRRHISRKVRHERTEHFEPIAPPARLTRHPRELPMGPIPQAVPQAQHIIVRIGSQARSDGQDLSFPRNRFNSIVPGDSASQAQPISQHRRLKVKQPRHHREGIHPIKQEPQVEPSLYHSQENVSQSIVSISDDPSEKFTSSSDLDENSNLFNEVPPPRVIGDRNLEGRSASHDPQVAERWNTVVLPLSIDSTHLFVSEWPGPKNSHAPNESAFSGNKVTLADSEMRSFLEDQQSRACKTDLATYRTSPRPSKKGKGMEMPCYESSARITHSPGQSLRNILQVIAEPKPPKLPRQTIDTLRNSDAVWSKFILGSETASGEGDTRSERSRPKIAASSMWVQPSSKDTVPTDPELSTERPKVETMVLNMTTKQSTTQDDMQPEVPPIQDEPSRKRQMSKRKRAEPRNDLYNISAQPRRSQCFRRG